MKVLGKGFAIIITIIFLQKSSFAQNIKLSGKITDSSGIAIADASVSIINNTTKNIIAYTFSNKAGEFTITVDSINQLSISISCIGYKKLQEPVTSTNNNLHFVLKKTQILLPTVEVKSSPINLQGDTVNYNLTFFTNPQDRVIGDVISKLPGIEVDASGRITYNGKPISHYYIDGLDLLGSKYNIANQNIPADLVEKIQLLNRHQAIKALDSFVSSNETALNLKLKSKAKNRLISNARIGIGVSPLLWNNEINTMNFRKNLQLIGAYKNNNSGNYLYSEVADNVVVKPLGEQVNEGAQSQLLNLVNLPKIELPATRYTFNNSHLGHLNILYQFKNKAQLKLNTNEYIDKTKKEGSNTTTYLLPSDTIVFNEIYYTTVTEKKFNTELNYTLNKQKYYLSNRLVYKNVHSFENGNVQTAQLNSQKLTSNLDDISNDFILSKVKNKSLINIFSKLNYTSAPQQLEVQPGSFPNVFNGGVNFASLVQKTNLKNLLTNTAITLTTKKKYFNYENKLGVKASNIYLQSYFLNPANSTVLLTADSLTNNVSWLTINPYLQSVISIEKNSKKIELALPLEVNYTTQNVHDSSKKTTYKNIFFNPRLTISVPLSPLTEIGVEFVKQTEIKSFSKIYDGYILNNYRSLSQGYSAIPKERLYNLKGSFSYQNPLYGTFFSFTTSYSILQKNLLLTTLYNNSYTKVQTIEKWNNQYSLVFTGYFNKYFLAAKTSVSLIYVGNMLNSLLLLQNIESRLSTLSQNLKIKIAVNKFSWGNIENTTSLLNSRSKIFQYAKDASVFTNFNIQNNTKLNFFFTEKIYGSLGAGYYNFSDNQHKHSSYLFLDAGLRYKYKRLDIESTLTNISNNKTFNTSSLSNNIGQQYSYKIRPLNFFLKTYFSF